MKAIVFLGTQFSGSSREALIAAKRLGYLVILFTNRINHIKNRSSFSEITDMIFCNLDDFQELKVQIIKLHDKGIEVVAIVSFIDTYCYMASLLAGEFGLKSFSTNAIFKMQNKMLSRLCLKNTPYVPWFKIVDSLGEIDYLEVKKRLPLVIKNPISTGSKDVYLVNTVEEFTSCMEILLSKHPHQVIVEQYVQGPQYLIETLVENSKVYIIAIIEQEVYIYNGHSIIIGYKLVHDLPKDMNSSLVKAINDIIKYHGMENGSCHLEMRYVNNSWKLIEINPRISGGAMNELIRYGLGINLVEETLKLALKEEINITPRFQLFINVQYLICNIIGKVLKVTGRIEAQNSPGVISVFIKPRRGQLIYPPVTMGNRYAYVIVSGLSEKEALFNAK
ncbi:MAG TPA: ATP-grasp domain-containing protein, partial [Haloplasmataceae bacterium]